jgi:hypothetical protein
LEFSKNFISESRGGITKALGFSVLSGPAFGQEMVNNRADQVSCYSTEREDNGAINGYWHPWTLMAGIVIDAMLSTFVLNILILL